jgi:hypothetical protein
LQEVERLNDAVTIKLQQRLLVFGNHIVSCLKKKGSKVNQLAQSHLQIQKRRLTKDSDFFPTQMVKHAGKLNKRKEKKAKAVEQATQFYEEEKNK